VGIDEGPAFEGRPDLINGSLTEALRKPWKITVRPVVEPPVEVAWLWIWIYLIDVTHDVRLERSDCAATITARTRFRWTTIKRVTAAGVDKGIAAGRPL
jgi:hypothetical protein